MVISGNLNASRRAGASPRWRRNFLGNRFVYVVVSQRARGLSIGINMNPGKQCNFNCVYCEVDRTEPARDTLVDIPVMGAELQAMLRLAAMNKIRELPGFGGCPPEWLELKEVALSGDGEPTLSPQFHEIVHEVTGVRSRRTGPFFKLVLITNTAGLLLPEVRQGLRLLSAGDEIWAKLDAGTQGYMDKVNAPDLRLQDVTANILAVARLRPVVIQSLFPLIDGEEPAEEEIRSYTHRLQELKAAGAQIALVQIYSAHRPAHRQDCDHLRLASLSRIARQVRIATGLEAEVF